MKKETERALIKIGKIIAVLAFLNLIVFLIGVCIKMSVKATKEAKEKRKKATEPECWDEDEESCCDCEDEEQEDCPEEDIKEALDEIVDEVEETIEEVIEDIEEALDEEEPQ